MTTPIAPAYVYPSTGEMNRYWLRQTVGPKPLAGAAFTAGWRTWENTPHEWHGNITGWSKRFGSALLDNGINTSTLVLWSRAVHQDPRYFRCECTGIKARARHALKLSVTSRGPNGDLKFSLAKILSRFAGPMVTRNTIYPDRYGFDNAAAGGAYAFAGSVGWNMLREFLSKSK